jgi:O-methyltransferase involved in polyketide biosynthesis
MTEPSLMDLNDVPETMLATLYIRALETKRPDALMRDERAVDLVRQYEPAFERIKRIRMDEEDRVSIILRSREIDNMVRGFLADRGRAAVVYLGCGLDARFERVDDGRVEWYDLDVPPVVALRRALLGGETPRYHLLAGSAFDHEWFTAVGSPQERAFLFVAEGLFQYFNEEQVRSLVVALRLHFPGSELVTDAFSPFIVHANNLRMRISRMGIRYHWGLRNGRDIEAWADGIRLLEEWFPFSRPEPRMAKLWWARNIPLIAKVMGVYHYQLGEAAA